MAALGMAKIALDPSPVKTASKLQQYEPWMVTAALSEARMKTKEPSFDEKLKEARRRVVVKNDHRLPMPDVLDSPRVVSDSRLVVIKNKVSEFITQRARYAQ